MQPDRIYTDHGLTGTNRARPRLREALAACRAGDTLVVTKLDGSLPDARDIVEELTEADVKLNIGGSIHDPADPVGRLLFNVLAMIAEFESDLIRMRTREGMKIAKAKGRPRGKQPKLKPAQEAHLAELWRAGQHTSSELAELFSVARSTVYRTTGLHPRPEPRRPARRPHRGQLRADLHRQGVRHTRPPPRTGQAQPDRTTAVPVRSARRSHPPPLADHTCLTVPRLTWMRHATSSFRDMFQAR